MWAVLAKLAGVVGGRWFDRAMTTVDTYVQSEAKKEEVRADVLKTYLTAQASVLTGPGWRWMMFFMALFILPYAAWWACRCLYQILWCSACAWPQAWSIGDLPEPQATQGGWIVASLFLAAGGVEATKRWGARK